MKRTKPTKSTSIKLAQDLARFLEERLSEKLTSVVLFGSVVREETKRESDTNETAVSYWSFAVRQELVTETRGN